MALKASRAGSQEGLRKKDISLQEGAHRVQHGTKVATPQKTGSDLPAALQGSPRQVGRAVALQGHISWWQTQLGPMLTPVGSRHFFHLGCETWPHSTACRLLCWDSQAKQPTGWEQSPTPPLDVSLSTRGPRPSSTHEWAWTSASHQEA